MFSNKKAIVWSEEIGVGRLFWIMMAKRTACNIAVAFAFGVAFHWLTKSDYDSTTNIQAGLMGILIYVIASTGLGMLNFVCGIILLFIDRGRSFRTLVLDILRAEKLPAPREYQSKTFSYLIEIADDESENPNVRVKCACNYTALKAVIDRSGFWATVAMMQAADDAVLRYAEESPARRA